MLLLVAGTDEKEVIRKGEALKSAKGELDKIGDELKRRVGRVTWDGEGGDAFREWGDDFAKQTLKLAQYIGDVGNAMYEAGNALSEVKKAMPKRPDGTGVCYADADKEKERLKTLKELEPETRDQLLRLAGSYGTQAGAIELSGKDAPVFKPLPAAALPSSSGYETWQESYGSSGGSEGTAASAASGVPRVQHAAQDSTFSAGHATNPSAPSAGGHVTVPDATHTNIDGVKELPRTDPSPTPTAPSPTGQQGPGRDITGMPVTPPVSPSPGSGRSGPTVKPVGRSGGPRLGGGKGLESVNARSTTDPVRANRDVVGGMPPRQTPTSGDARAARGPVIGGEQGRTVGRTGVPTTTGQGVVGGRPVAGAPSRASASSARRGRVARSASELRINGEFTQGGSGLVRGSAGVSGVPSRKDPRRSKKRDGGETPDYLTEDEETWTGGERRNAPPVIE
ncbi:WXG100 family type VII secretion target [Streptomyces sp. NBRC 110028]|uniref:WXG100 family type VII secretion target n=1 Tax=Streptomyces sp. NBRC 110028 TaxID=1621260 RepID=UPI00131EB258|nr:hypothetical protein [Streptomyces sp. NBRC 110028]